MKYQKKIIVLLLATSIMQFGFSQTQGRSIGRGYSKKLLEQEKYFDDLKKSNGEKYGNKEVSVEMAINKMVDISIENNNRSIEIKTWDEPKIKITTMVYFDGAMSKLSSESWFEKLNIKTKLLGNNLRIKTDALTNSNSSNSNYNSNNTEDVVEVYSVDGQYIKSEPAKKRVVKIYIPKDNKLTIESKYADIVILDYLKKLTADITNGNLELENVNSINLRSKYSNVSIKEIQFGEIDFINGKLSIGTLGDVELETKYSTVEVFNSRKIIFKSTNDDYELENVTAIECTKNYGSLRINTLTESFQMEGTNADVKIKTISAELKSIWVDNKYADLRMPLKNIKNFTVNFEGTYSNIYKNYESNKVYAYDNSNSRISTGDAQNSKYSAIVGTGNGSKIDIHCQNCTVDFK